MRSGTSGTVGVSGLSSCELPTFISSCSGDSHDFCAVHSPVMLGSAGIGATTDMPAGSHIGAAARAIFGASNATQSAHKIAAQRPTWGRLPKRLRNERDGI